MQDTITSVCRYGPCGSDQLVVTERQKLVTNSAASSVFSEKSMSILLKSKAARILALARPGSPIAKANTSTCLLQLFPAFSIFRRFGAHLPGSFAAHLQVRGGHSVFDVVCLCLMKHDETMLCILALEASLLTSKSVISRSHWHLAGDWRWRCHTGSFADNY